MKSKILVLSFFAMIVCTANAHADVQGPAGPFIEPGITYQWSHSTNINLPSPLGTSQGNLDGFGVMGRVGLHLLDVLWVAADGRYARPTYHNSEADYHENASEYNYGITGGIQTPFAGVRLWGGWIIGGGLDPQSSGASDVNFTKGSGWRVGAGVYVSSVSLNFEYQHITYGNVELQSLGSIPVNSNLAGTNAVDGSYVVSMSFPFAL